MTSLERLALPERGGEVNLVAQEGQNSHVFTLRRPRRELGPTETSALLLEWAIPTMLSHLSIDRIIQILGLLLVEMKVIVVSADLSALSSVTLGLMAMLHPLAWAGPVITVLPPSLHEYIEVCGPC